MKKVLIIGSKGMAGHVLTTFLKESQNFIIADISRNDDFFDSVYKADVTDTRKLDAIIDECAPDIVVNCIGILNKDAEDNPDKTIFLNSYLPHFLAKKGDRLGYKLIHISTDCVFSGKAGGYAETSITDGIGFYAKSKALGEVNYGQHLTIRTSIIGPELKKEGIGLFNWFMRQTGEIDGYTNAYWTGVTTLVLAKAILSGIVNDFHGVHHLVYDKKISKYEMILIFQNEFHKNDISIKPNDQYRVDKSLVVTRNEKLFDVPGYEVMFNEMHNWMLVHKEFYQRYFIDNRS